MRTLTPTASTDPAQSMRICLLLSGKWYCGTRLAGLGADHDTQDATAIYNAQGQRVPFESRLVNYAGEVCALGVCNAMTCPTEPFSGQNIDIDSGHQYMNGNPRVVGAMACADALPPSPPPPPISPPSPPPAPCCDFVSLTTVFDVPGEMLNCFTGPPFAKTDVVHNNRHVYRKGTDGPFLFFQPYVDDQGANLGPLLLLATSPSHIASHPCSYQAHMPASPPFLNLVMIVVDCLRVRSRLAMRVLIRDWL